jgi:hypothetical protein
LSGSETSGEQATHRVEAMSVLRARWARRWASFVRGYPRTQSASRISFNNIIDGSWSKCVNVGFWSIQGCQPSTAASQAGLQLYPAAEDRSTNGPALFKNLHKRLLHSPTHASHFGPPHRDGGAKWVRTELVADVCLNLT